MAAHPLVLLFDLGGVIMDLRAFENMCDLLDGRLTTEEVKDRWGVSPSLLQFESGQMSLEAFAAAFVEEWDLPLTPSAFLEEFKTWPGTMFDGIHDILVTLGPRHRLGCLSNTNHLHVEYVSEQFDLFQYFEHVYLSHELGLFKPDASIFHHVIEDLGTAPEEILFFDDSLRNVEAARSCGLQADHVCGPIELRTALETRALL